MQPIIKPCLVHESLQEIGETGRPYKWIAHQGILYLICIICSYFNVTSSGHQIAMKPEQTVYDQGRTTLYRLLRYIGQYRCNAVFT